SVLLSEPITFLIGPEKKRFTMHKIAVATLSKSLDQLVNGPMKEAQNRCVCWEDTDEKTFIRFGEWAYTGGYKAEGSEILLDSSQIATSDQDPSPVTKQEPIAKSLATLFQMIDPAQHCGRAVGSYPPVQSMVAQFVTNAEYIFPTPVRRLSRTNKESCEVYTQVFLCHAKLYVLADKYDIPELRKLSLHNLHETLIHFTLYHDRIGDIISLVRYSFENTVEHDKLRSLLIQYCACYTKEITKGKDLQELITECPDFAYGMLKELGRHLN
ncbi:hypothetical protein BBK36DRAFT_1125998, partial [Trichoderma citrinoviride]